MRISDWSSDVCSSDLINAVVRRQRLRKFREGALQQSHAVWRIEEHDIEAMPRLRQVIQRVELGNFSMLRFEKLQRGTDRTGLLAAFLDETATRRAARQRLDAKRAAAGKQIQAARAINTRCEPIEQGLPDTIGSWPHEIGRAHV